MSKLKSNKMKKYIILLILFTKFCFAQNIVNTIYDDNGDHFVYNGNLIFSGNSGGVAPVFSKYDGIIATPVENPTGFTETYVDYPITYNNEFYFKSSGNYLGRYNGSNVSFISKVSPTDFGLSSYPVIYNSKLNYIYRNSSNLRQLASFDGTTQTIYSNPDSSTNGFVYTLAAFNGEQFFGYINQSGNIVLAKFNGTSISLIDNANSTDWGIYSQNACVVNNVLIFLYQTSDSKVHFAKYDGSSITVVPNLASNDDIIFSNLIAYNGAVYARYKNGTTNKFHLAKYDGTTLTMLPNITSSDNGYIDSPFVYNNKLYIRYVNSTSSANLVRTDGTVLEILPIKYLGGYGTISNYALEIAGNVYFKTQVAGFTTLGKFDGTSLVSYQNAGNTDPMLGVNNLVHFNNKIHFIASNGVSDKLSFLDLIILSKPSFDMDTVKIYPNPSSDYIAIETNDLIKKISIYSIEGKEIFQNEYNDLKVEIPVHEYKKGIYVITILNSNDTVETKKIIIN